MSIPERDPALQGWALSAYRHLTAELRPGPAMTRGKTSKDEGLLTGPGGGSVLSAGIREDGPEEGASAEAY
ncbi:MAG: hypothetical protein M0Z41_15230 [Peptococcaceae bacterium]|jgi:hypothetical protein|nr:hypothetical protein [Peptococcaceae bacterium]